MSFTRYLTDYKGSHVIIWKLLENYDSTKRSVGLVFSLPLSDEPIKSVFCANSLKLRTFGEGLRVALNHLDGLQTKSWRVKGQNMGVHLVR